MTTIEQYFSIFKEADRYTPEECQIRAVLAHLLLEVPIPEIAFKPIEDWAVRFRSGEEGIELFLLDGILEDNEDIANFVFLLLSIDTMTEITMGDGFEQLFEEK